MITLIRAVTARTCCQDTTDERAILPELYQLKPEYEKSSTPLTGCAAFSAEEAY
jgi:hypothetical protein